MLRSAGTPGTTLARLLIAFTLAVGWQPGTVVAADPPTDGSLAGRLADRERPFVIFQPVPPKPPPIASYPLPDGAEDYWDLFAPDAPWREAAGRIDAFGMHAWMIRHFASDDDLRLMLAFLEERGIAFGLEMEPLEWPGAEVCDHVEGFEGPYDLEAARTSAIWAERSTRVVR